MRPWAFRQSARDPCHCAELQLLWTHDAAEPQRIGRVKKDVIILGAGAAGLMCAMEAGKRSRSVLVLEHAERLGKKILISGGGRCNFTNANAGPENYLSANPHFCKSALARFTPDDFLALVEKYRIPYHEKKLGQLFCDVSSKSIVELLEAECRAAHVQIRLDCRVQEISMSVGFRLETSQGQFESDALVVATGGLSFPKLGATGFGYRIAEQFGLKITEVRPGLVPLTFAPEEQTWLGELSGVSLDVEVSCAGQTFRENLLLTHKGLSGPAILQISNYSGPGEAISINLLPEQSAADLLAQHQGGHRELITVLSQYLPRRFVQQWCARFAPRAPCPAILRRSSRPSRTSCIIGSSAPKSPKAMPRRK